MFTLLFLSTLVVAISSDVKVVSTVTGGDRGLDSCVRQCYGSTGETTAWQGGSSSAYTYFDPSTGCGFLAGTSPMVSANLVGDSWVGSTNGVNLYKESTIRYRVHVRFQYQQRSNNVLMYAKKYKWRVDWTAVGYTC